VPDPSARVGVIVPAAGAGRRLGSRDPKPLVWLAEQPLLGWALAGVEANRCVHSVVVVADPSIAGAVREMVAARPFAKVAAVVAGGATRRASVAAGLAALPPGPTHVAVHDACRPLVAAGAIDRLLEALESMPGRFGIAPGVPVTDTVRRVAGGDCSGGIVDRDDLRAVQTPQLYLRRALEQAHRRAAGAVAAGEGDDVVLVERAGFAVAVVPGEPENLKITTPVDLLAAEALLAEQRRASAPRRIGLAGQATRGGPR
jgi:2-C-methyl-D-erythritol 4-phosphate cytidylyltransferase